MFSNSNVIVTGSNLYNVEGNYNAHVQKRTGLDILHSYMAEGALHNSGERFEPPKCHPKTRTAVLRKIVTWIETLDPSSPAMMWLYGSAGVGKSAIAQTIAEMCYDSGFLIASFFFSRNTPGRNDAKRLIATIAYQLALSIPEVRDDIERAVDTDPALMSRSLETQAHILIANPLLNIIKKSPSLSLQRLIILDGLDECEGSTTQSAIIDLFGKLIMEYRLPLLVLFACRPEHHIRNTFNRQDINNLTDHIALDDDIHSDDDIEKFLRGSFQEIRETHPMQAVIPECWPSSDVVNVLVAKSSGQFIYAYTVMKYVNSADHRPMDRLEVVFGISSAGDETPFSELDGIYKHILSTARDIDLVLRILSILVYSDRFRYGKITGRSLHTMEALLGLETGDILITLKDMHSIVNIPRSPYLPIRIRHASLADFLMDRHRSQAYFLDCTVAHTNLALSCIRQFSDRSLTEEPFIYATLALVSHCQQGDFSEGLIDSLLTFNFLKWVRAVRSMGDFGYKGPLCRIITSLFQWLEKWQTHSRGRELRDHFTALLDRHFRSELEKSPAPAADYLVTVFSFVLLSTTGCFPFKEGNRWYNSHSERLWQIDSESLSILDNEGDNKYIQLFRDFINDPQRAGKFAVSGDVYARITLGLIRQLVGEHEQINQGTAELDTIQIPICLPGEQNIHFGQGLIPHVARNVILDRLPDMLSKSSSSKELYDILTVYLSFGFDESFITPSIQEAMVNYLQQFKQNFNCDVLS